jgi:hypothetical protein
MGTVLQVSYDSFESIAEKLNLSEDERRTAATFVLLNPDLLKAQYPDSKTLATTAEGLLENGNSVVAKNRFASAAKLALYEGDLASGRAYLEKAVSIDKGSSYDFALSNFDKVSKFVVEFYKSKAGRAS